MYEESKATLYTKEFQFKDEPSNPTMNDVSADNINLLKDASLDQDRGGGVGGGEDAKYLLPIAHAQKNAGQTSRMEWILNDLFLMMTIQSEESSEDCKVMIMDSLLFSYTLMTKDSLQGG